MSPGYLNRQSLLGEHRELHGIVSIIVNKKKGYSRHPETMRWKGCGWALKMRHRQLACEMALRGYTDRSPVNTDTGRGRWPENYIDEPDRQFILLKEKYVDREEGRIPMPVNQQQLWSQHKYSVLARSPELYSSTGRSVSKMTPGFAELALLFSRVLREEPSEGGIRNAVQHMWGHVSDFSDENAVNVNSWPLVKLLVEIQRRAMAGGSQYLMASTALSELMVWLPDESSF